MILLRREERKKKKKTCHYQGMNYTQSYYSLVFCQFLFFSLRKWQTSLLPDSFSHLTNKIAKKNLFTSLSFLIQKQEILYHILENRMILSASKLTCSTIAKVTDRRTFCFRLQLVYHISSEFHIIPLPLPLSVISGK